MKPHWINPIILGLLLFVACGPAEQEEAAIGSGDPGIDEISAQIAQNPNDPSLYAARAKLYYERSSYDEAITDLTTALRFDSTNVDYLHLLADVNLDYFRSKEALDLMKKAAAMYPERVPTLLKLSEFQHILKQYDASLQTLSDVLKLDPQEPEAYFMMGMNFEETGDTIPAINSFQEVVKIDPEHVDAYIKLGVLYGRRGNLKRAEQYFDNAIEADSGNVHALHAKADFLRDQDKLPEAIEYYRAAVRADPLYEQAYYNIGLLYMEMDSVEKAYQQFDLAIETGPLYVPAYFFRGYAAEILGRLGQARTDYQHALRLAPDYTYAKEGLARLNQADRPTEGGQ